MKTLHELCTEIGSIITVKLRVDTDRIVLASPIILIPALQQTRSPKTMLDLKRLTNFMDGSGEGDP